MARSSKPNAVSRNAKSQSGSGKSTRSAFLSGLVIGGLVMYFVPSLLATNPTLQSSSVSDFVETAKVQELKFDFYELLKDNEILIPDAETTFDSASAQSKNFQYLLQVGSFKNLNDSENLKVQLLLMNLPASSESVKSKNGDTWHRVLVGPFANTSKMGSAKAKLAQNDIESLMLKRKKEDL